jgi:hypothetical protein
MVRWEYKSTRHPGELNRLGADGWELVLVWCGAFYLKRPIA